jgi:hypothetical protein
VSDPVTATIESAITECEAHRQKLEHGQSRLSGVFPLTESRLAGLDEQTVATLNERFDIDLAVEAGVTLYDARGRITHEAE